MRPDSPRTSAKPDPILDRRAMVGRWIGLIVFVIVLGIVFVNLGEWQLRRLAERRASNAEIIAAEKAAPVPYTQYFGTDRAVAPADAWHRVTLTGTFDAEHQLVVRFRSNAGDTGYEVVTPLRTRNGPAVLVDRGFVALQSGQQMPTTAPPPPSGVVTITGHVRDDEHGRAGATRPAEGSVRLINAVEIGRTLPYPIADGYVGLLTITPAQQGDFVPVQTPELSDGPHLWYAVQWFMFTAIGVGGIFVFIRSDLRERKAAREKDAAGAGPSPDAPSPDSEASDPEGTEPASTDPASTDPARTDPASTDERSDTHAPGPDR